MFNTQRMVFKKIFFLLLINLYVISIKAFSLEDINTSAVVDADIIEYNQAQNTVVAKGDVEIFKNNYLLKADQVIYNKSKNKVYAIGNVYILDPTGVEVYAEKLEIDRELKLVVIENFNMRLSDNSLFIANNGTFTYPDNTLLNHAVYSPCPICQDRKYPQWQFSAKQVSIDEKLERVSYKHSFFEVFGRPVLYTPYFSHPTPNAKPKSGFLAPKYSNTTFYGQGIFVPYYYRIADNKDLTFTPIFTSKQGIIYTAEYQHLTRSGFYSVNGSYNKSIMKSSVEPSNHYYVNITGNTNIDEVWSFNTNLHRVGDKSYLRNYFSNNQNYLTSKAEFFYNQGRDYAQINSLYFQELRPIFVQSAVPIITPSIQYHKEFEGENRNRYIIDNDFLWLSRKQGSGTRRLSSTGSWNKTYITNNGQQISFYRRLRGDAYNFTNNNSASTGPYQNNKGVNNVGRLIPEMEMKWQYPFVTTNSGSYIFIEPIATIVVSPNISTMSNIVNEDSQEIEISDDNLFLANRYAGLDRVENGLRGAYGLNTYYLTKQDIMYNALIGQGYRMNNNNLDYGIDSGLQNNLSDMVGRFGIKPWKPLEVSYRFRYDPTERQLRRSEVRTDVIYRPFSFFVGLVDYNYRSQRDPAQANRSIDLGGGIAITSQWVINASIKQNYSPRKKFLVSSGGSIGYNGDCTNMIFSVNNDYTHDVLRNFKKDLKFVFELHFKNIN